MQVVRDLAALLDKHRGRPVMRALVCLRILTAKTHLVNKKNQHFEKAICYIRFSPALKRCLSYKGKLVANLTCNVDAQRSSWLLDAAVQAAHRTQ
jgi:hypothetical protein